MGGNNFIGVHVLVTFPPHGRPVTLALIGRVLENRESIQPLPFRDRFLPLALLLRAEVQTNAFRKRQGHDPLLS